jgi:hypothetical protein
MRPILIVPLMLMLVVATSDTATPQAVEIQEWEVPWPDTRPRDPYVAPDGRVWFVGQRADYVAWLDPETGRLERRWARPPHGLPHPHPHPLVRGGHQHHRPRPAAMTRVAPALLAGSLLAGLSASAEAYRSGAPAAHTGGFGEPHCGACHFTGRPNADAGSARIEAPGQYQPGASYEIAVVVTHPDLLAAGFQLTARFADGARAGRQAGRLVPTDGRTRAAPGSNAITYIGHTEAGAIPATAGLGHWVVRWTAPDSGEPVLFHVAANAANDDDSEFGDHVYLARHRTEPGPGPR